MLDPDHGDAPRRKTGDKPRHGANFGRRQTGHDLVKQHEFRPQRQCAGNLEPLEQANRERGNRRAGIVSKAHIGEGGFRQRARSRD